jgi:uncharacterized protein YifE (UPF0438 family)
MRTEQHPFEFGCSTDIFPANELTALLEMGGRLEALATGEVKPADAEERHFLKVDRDEAAPKTILERAWLRLKGRREYERDQAKSMPPEPAPDYGMVEFDHDRCWW